MWEIRSGSLETCFNFQESLQGRSIIEVTGAKLNESTYIRGFHYLNVHEV